MICLALRLWLGVTLLNFSVVGSTILHPDVKSKPNDSVPGTDEKAEQILKVSHDYVAARSFEIQQIGEQTAQLLIDGKPLGSPQTTKQTSMIEVDAKKGLVRMTMKDQSGKDLVVIRKGDHIAIKIGSDPWSAPKGAYARIGDSLANPFACPLPKAGQKNSPKWAIMKDEVLDGQEMTVIKTVGESANQYTMDRMGEGIASLFPDASTRPSIEVVSYESRHWVGKADNRRQRVEQTSHYKMTMPGVAKAVVDIVGKTTASYSRYNTIDISLPEEAGRILNSGDQSPK